MSTPRTGNRLLDLLPDADRKHLLAAAQRVAEPVGHTTIRQDGPITYVYFPITAMYSAVIDAADGQRAEAATVGNEGMVGLPLFLGIEFSTATIVLQVPGEALRVRAALFRQAVESSGRLHRLLQRYTVYCLRYANQTVMCNALHAVRERAARWLLMAHDRAGKDEFLLTHEFLAQMLGVRRQSVSLVAGQLQRAGVIEYRRGVVRVLDRKGLEAASCECHEVTRQFYARLIG